MNKNYICLIFGFLFIFCLSVSADPLPKSVLLPSASVAVRDDSMAIVLNQAGLGTNKGINASYFHTLSGETGGDNAFFLSSSGAGFGAEFVDQKAKKFTKYTLSDGYKLANGLYLGTGYSWFSSKDKKYDSLSSWDIGLLCRPANSLSFGLVTRNLNRPRFNGIRTDRIYDISVAIRPFTNRITLSWNNSLQEGKNLKDSDYNIALDLEPIDGLLLRGCYFRDHSFEVSIGMGLPKFEIGTYRRFDEDRNGINGGVYAQLSTELHRSKLQASKYVLEMDTMDADLLTKAKKDDTIDGIILKPAGDYSMGIAQEMRDAISDFKSAGKTAICYMETAGNKEYYVASACDKLYLNPAGSLALYGLRSEVTSYKGLLDKLGVKADLYRIGKYKSASEMLTDERMSDGTRESLNSILDDLHDQMLNGIAESRKVNTDKVQGWIDNGPYTAKEAKKAELVDDLIYSDQIDDTIKQVMGRRVENVTSEEYGGRKYHRYDWREKQRIAVIYASGLMLSGNSVNLSIMGSDTISEAIKEARMDDSIKAIVLRIDSGGGAVFASDIIWREVILAKRKKPFIVSMGDVAASGGYYIACPADAIVAEPGTITGSIGIITGKINLRGLYDKLGIKKEILKRGKNSDINSDYEDFTDEQREIVERQMNEIYQTFVSKVADGRKMKEEAVDSIAQGRVWTGRQAQKNGLVDKLGGLQLAMSIAKEKANLKDENPEIIALPRQDSLWRMLTMENMSFLNDLRTILYLMKIEKTSNDNFYFLMPYVLDYE